MINLHLHITSEGFDTQQQNPLSICLEKYAKRSDDKVTIHIIGYGDDVDLKLLEALADEGKGVFYHTTEPKDIETAFGLAYGNITSVVARNLQVRVIVNPGPVVCTIPLIYSKDGADVFSLPDIIVNQQKDMIFMLKAQYKKMTRASNFDPVTILVSYEDNEGNGYQRNASLNVRFVPWGDIEPAHEQTVFMNWYRVKGAYCLREARRLADNRQFREADERLANGIELLMSSGFETHEYIAPVISDLHKAKEIVQSDETWQRGGDAHFASISYSHYSQSASVGALHYSTSQQSRTVANMHEIPLPEILEEPEAQNSKGQKK